MQAESTKLLNPKPTTQIELFPYCNPVIWALAPLIFRGPILIQSKVQYAEVMFDELK